MAKPHPRVLLAVLLGSLLGLSVGPVQAQTQADQQRVEDRIRSTRALVGEASAEESRLLGLVDASRRRERDLMTRVAVVDGQIAAISRDLDQAQARLATLEVRQQAAQRRLDELREELAASKRALTRQAVHAYTGQTEAARYAGMLLDGSPAHELVAKRSYLRAAVGNQTDLIVAAERLRNEVADRRDELIASRTAAAAERDAVAGQRNRLAATRATQEKLRADTLEELATRDRLRAEAVARKREFQTTLDSLERESREIAEALRRRAESAAGGSPGGGSAPGRLGMPIPGARIVSVFGPRVHPIYGDVRIHTGIDLDATTGTPIRAAAPGVVVSAQVFGGYGNCTIVDHGGGLTTLYAHQSAMSVSAGQRVGAGQVIGRVGSTGASTGPHLHFEVRRRGEPVNPTAYL